MFLWFNNPVWKKLASDEDKRFTLTRRSHRLVAVTWQGKLRRVVAQKHLGKEVSLSRFLRQTRGADLKVKLEDGEEKKNEKPIGLVKMDVSWATSGGKVFSLFTSSFVIMKMMKLRKAIADSHSLLLSLSPFLYQPVYCPLNPCRAWGRQKRVWTVNVPASLTETNDRY